MTEAEAKQKIIEMFASAQECHPLIPRRTILAIGRDEEEKYQLDCALASLVFYGETLLFFPDCDDSYQMNCGACDPLENDGQPCAQCRRRAATK